MPLGVILLLLGKVPLLPIDETVKCLHLSPTWCYLAIRFFSTSKSRINEAQLGDRIQGLTVLKLLERGMEEAALNSLGIAVLWRAHLAGPVSGTKWRAFVLHILHHNVSAQVWSSYDLAKHVFAIVPHAFCLLETITARQTPAIMKLSWAWQMQNYSFHTPACNDL